MSPEETSKLEKLQEIIGITFQRIELLKQALIHRSYVNEIPDKNQLQHNERIEFLGDAVLELIITEYLFATYPKHKEGELTSFRAATVRTSSLAETAETINLGEYIYLSNGEERTGGRKRPYILANTFESLLGAIYLDQGLEKVKDFLNKTLIPKIANIITHRLDIDSKSKLQEMAQETLGITPSYYLLSAVGPDHAKEFQMSVKIGEKECGEGKGRNKQEAEENAAKDALKHWKNIVPGKLAA